MVKRKATSGTWATRGLKRPQIGEVLTIAVGIYIDPTMGVVWIRDRPIALTPAELQLVLILALRANELTPAEATAASRSNTEGID